jgi:hypothetical protein
MFSAYWLEVTYEFSRTDKKFVQPCLNVRKGRFTDVIASRTKYNLYVLLASCLPKWGSVQEIRPVLRSFLASERDYRGMKMNYTRCSPLAPSGIKEWHARWMLTEFVITNTFQKFLLVESSNSVFGTAHAKLSVFICCIHTYLRCYKK